MRDAEPKNKITFLLVLSSSDTSCIVLLFHKHLPTYEFWINETFNQGPAPNRTFTEWRSVLRFNLSLFFQGKQPQNPCRSGGCSNSFKDAHLRYIFQVAAMNSNVKSWAA